jgi:hypothetical protein
MQDLTHDEIHWIVISINNEIRKIDKQTSSFNEADSFKYGKENEGYVQILLSAKNKLINGKV